MNPSEKDISLNISRAYHLYHGYGRDLLQDRHLCTLLEQLERNIDSTQQEMLAAGGTRECADCAIHGEGTCCGIRTGYKCDVILLLINLLLGRKLQHQPAYPEHCFFLADTGCSLLARHIICVNFLCQRLRDNIPHKKLVLLQHIAGKEMHTLFILEEYMNKNTGISNALFI